MRRCLGWAVPHSERRFRSLGRRAGLREGCPTTDHHDASASGIGVNAVVAVEVQAKKRGDGLRDSLGQIQEQVHLRAALLASEKDRAVRTVSSRPSDPSRSGARAAPKASAWQIGRIWCATFVSTLNPGLRKTGRGAVRKPIASKWRTGRVPGVTSFGCFDSGQVAEAQPPVASFRAPFCGSPLHHPRVRFPNQPGGIAPGPRSSGP